jgi:NAD dependent epimerase/dehydratase family.
MSKGKIIILGINGHIGQAAARAFAAAGWQVSGFGRSNRYRPEGVRFIEGDAADEEAMRSAIGDADVVFNGLNLPYADWFGGRAEAQLARVIAAMGKVGRTLLFPGNIYNYAASERVIGPETPQHPERPRGAVRVAMERRIAAAGERGDIRGIILRAGDFYGPDSSQDWFDQVILREAGKGRVALPAHEVPHSWAYLPDLAQAFVVLAEKRHDFKAFERFHFAGDFVTAAELFAVMETVAGRRLKRVGFPWTMIAAMGLVSPTMREVARMRYLWDNPMALGDPRLEALLGPGFGTDFPAALGGSVAKYFAAGRQAA